MTTHEGGMKERAARDICAALRREGFRALFAGGCVRDLLMGMPPKDYDIATNALPEQVMALFPHHAPVGAAFGVVLVIRPEGPFEVATFRTDGPYLDGRRPAEVTYCAENEDAARRDFTINAMFLDPETDEVIDWVGGREDLAAKVVRAVGDPVARFREDRLRLLRAVRFASRLGFALDPDTRAAILAEADSLHSGVSLERVREELVKMFTEGRAGAALTLLDETGLLAVVLPEVQAMKGVEQPPEFHPEGDVFIHTRLMLGLLPADCTPTLAMGTLLHDAGKPLTQTFEDRIRFNLHEKVGAHIARAVTQRLRFSNQESDRIVWLTENHMRVSAIPKMREGKRRIFVTEPGFDELLKLCRLDCLSSHRDLSGIDWVEQYRDSLPADAPRPPRVFNGHDLLALGYAAGPQFSKILAAVEEAQLEGAVSTKEEAAVFVRRHFTAE
jgi:poly(A) polymerase